MPVINHRQESSEQIESIPYYDIKKTFNPGNDKSPYNGFASQINTESQLRNQFFALQRSDKSVYIPS